jgi:hypothetical protein
MIAQWFLVLSVVSCVLGRNQYTLSGGMATAEGVSLAEDVVDWEPQPAAGVFSSGWPAGNVSPGRHFLLIRV